jgi:hypothetical protein
VRHLATRTIEIRDIEDAYVDDSDRDDNYGKREALYVNNGSYVKKTFIKFNINNHIPSDATITSAILHINAYFSRGAWLDLYKATGQWQENTITFNNRPKVALLKSNILYISEGNQSRNFSLNLTDYIYQLEPYGMCLTTKNYNEEVWFKSNDGSPQLYLEVAYTTDKPSQPSTIVPIGGEILNRNTTVKFEWDSINQASYQLNYGTDNVNWNTATGTTNKYHNLNISMPKGKLYWRVRYKDNNEIWSVYTPTVVCEIGEKPPTPIISINRNVISWDKISQQIKYQVQLIKDNIVIEDSGEIYSIDNNYTLKTTLLNNSVYTIKVKVIDDLNIESLWGQKTITTNYIEPLQPRIQLINDNIRGSITVKCIKPSSGELITYFEVFRKEQQGEYIKIAKNIIDTYTDYTPISGLNYKYMIRGFTASGGFMDSPEASKSIKLRHSQLAIAGNYDNYINLKYNPQREINTKYKSAEIMFAGRERPVYEIGEHTSNNIKLSFLITSDEELDNLLKIINKRTTLLYRDNRGRKSYCIITSINYTDKQRFISDYEVSFEANEIDNNEVVT